MHIILINIHMYIIYIHICIQYWLVLPLMSWNGKHSLGLLWHTVFFSRKVNKALTKPWGNPSSIDRHLGDDGHEVSIILGVPPARWMVWLLGKIPFKWMMGGGTPMTSWKPPCGGVGGDVTTHSCLTEKNVSSAHTVRMVVRSALCWIRPNHHALRAACWNQEIVWLAAGRN